MRPPQPTCTGITRFIPGLTLISGFSPALLRTELLVAVTVFAVLVPSAMAYGTDLLDKPVLVGYIFGATLIVIGSQLGKMFGIKLESDKFFQQVAEPISDTGLMKRPGEEHIYPSVRAAVAYQTQ